ncbi:hypothetical protein SO802_008458 [Lithocarpus litseifolius]|uniref:RNase H type-1 domain-containing protein n=1 Tax=Lithocarpus litseifolius TaxID=425828 RepID=A0AAW2D9C9_9ROSI
MAWVKWDKVCEPKAYGGMGFRDLKAFNRLNKAGGSIKAGILLSIVYKSKYFPDDDFIHAKKGHHPSFAWRSIWVAQSLISDNVKWQVRNADSILSIPLSTILPADELVWTAAANGKFSVKSAYHLARSGKGKERGESSDPSLMKRFWQKLWRAKIPTKVRAFGWKACQNILPTKMNLFHRQVLEDPICDECGLEPKTVIHVLCQCSKAREVWNLCHLQHLIEGKGDFADMLWKCSVDLNKESNMLDMVLMIAWTQETPTQTRSNSPGSDKWTPPPTGWYKVNIDGVVFSKHKWTGIGVIARDDQDRVVAAMSKRMLVPLGALEIEAKALEVAAGFARDLDIQKVVFESDSLLVCSAIQGVTEPPTTIANIISGTTQHMQQLHQVEIQHTWREGNKAAHGLAQHAQYVDDYVTWMEEAPTMIEDVIASDVIQLVQN